MKRFNYCHLPIISNTTATMLPATLPPTTAPNGNSGGSITVVVTVGTGGAAGA